MELNLLLDYGVSSEKIWINTPYLHHELVEKCIQSTIFIHADSIEQIELIEQEARRQNKRVLIGIRINFPTLNTSRFGIECSKSCLNKVITLLRSSTHLELNVLHTHFSGSVRDPKSFATRVEALYTIYNKWFKSFPVSSLNVGGGISGPMDHQLANQFNYPVTQWIDYAIAVQKHLPHFHKTGLKLTIEPGMALVANTFYFLAEVISVRKINYRTNVVLNTSKIFLKPTNHNKSLSFTVYPSLPSNKKINHHLTGITCMENDDLGEYEGFLKKGDLVLFKNVGAYTQSYRPNFIFAEPKTICINTL